MARNKTRLAKLKTAARRHEQTLHQVDGVTGSETAKVALPGSVFSPIPSKTNIQALFGYPVSLIYRDLLKSVVVVTVLIAMVIGWALLK